MDSTNSLSFLPLGGVGDVTRNMYVYEYQDQILLVDCGLGFADETMLGVDLLLPDISYLLKTKKKIVGMVLTHGHEDHIGGLPFILPQLPDFPIFATPLTAAFANEKLKEFDTKRMVKAVSFEQSEVVIGSFSASFIRVTHSVPDTSHIFIKTPVGNIYHGSDFKFDLTPADGKKTDFQKIVQLSSSNVLCLMSDCLGSERPGYTPSEEELTQNFEREARLCRGKFIITTYSSNISRLNQAIQVAQTFNRKVCFIGRSLIKAKEVARSLGILALPKNAEIAVDEIKNYPGKDVLLIIAGSQGQENSAMTRIANNEHKEVHLAREDTVIFSADPIPGNEVSVNSLIDTIAKSGARVIYSAVSGDFHVSGHGSAQDVMLLMSLVKAKKLLPIGGTFRQMVAYKQLAKKQGYTDEDVFLIDDGQEVIFSKEKTVLGKKIQTRNVYVDQISGEEVESFVLRDRQKISLEGIVIVLAEVDTANGTMIGPPEIIARGFSPKDAQTMQKKLVATLPLLFAKNNERVTNWIHIRKRISDASEQHIFRLLRRRPLILPVIIEV